MVKIFRALTKKAEDGAGLLKAYESLVEEMPDGLNHDLITALAGPGTRSENKQQEVLVDQFIGMLTGGDSTGQVVAITQKHLAAADDIGFALLDKLSPSSCLAWREVSVLNVVEWWLDL
jgi:hypothetical protein